MAAAATGLNPQDFRTLLGRMERENAKIGLATMCIGVGQGTAMLLERV